MSVDWYVLRSKPNKEFALWKQLTGICVEVYYPQYRVSPVNPRSQVVKPYFPGYMFVQVNLALSGLSLFQWMPYSLGLVCFGGQPAVVADATIQALRKQVELREKETKLPERLSPGDVVSICSGPFAGYDAVFDTRLSGEERIRVFLNFLDKHQVPLELSLGSVKKI